MTTYVYWHDQGSGLWQDPGNWNDQQDGSGGFLGSFVGDEYFYWNGTGAGSNNDCTLSSFNSINCEGLSDQGDGNTLTIYIQSSCTLELTGDDNNIGGDVLSLYDNRIDVSPGSLLSINTSNSFETVTLSGNGTGNGNFSQITLNGSDNEIYISTYLTLNDNLNVSTPFLINGSNLNVHMTNGLTLFTSGGEAIGNSGSNNTFEIAGAFTVYDVQEGVDIINSSITYVSSGSGNHNVQLVLVENGQTVTVPDWATDATGNGGYLSLNQNEYSSVYGGASPGWASTYVLERAIFENKDFAGLYMLTPIGITTANCVCTYRFDSDGVSDWGFTTAELGMAGGTNGTSTTYYQYDPTETYHCNILVTNNFYGNSSTEQAKWGINLQNWIDDTPFGQFSAQTVNEWLAPPGGMAALADRNIVIDSTLPASNGTFNLKNNVAVNDVTFLYDARLSAAIGASTYAFDGKLTFGSGSVEWGNQFFVAATILNIATSADPFESSLVTSFSPVSGETDHLEICNPNATPITLGNHTTTIEYVEITCGSAISEGSDDGNNSGIMFFDGSSESSSSVSDVESESSSSSSLSSVSGVGSESSSSSSNTLSSGSTDSVSSEISSGSSSDSSPSSPSDSSSTSSSELSSSSSSDSSLTSLSNSSNSSSSDSSLTSLSESSISITESSLSSSSNISSSSSMVENFNILNELSIFRGVPSVGGMPLNFITMLNRNSKDITLGFATPSAVTCRTDYFYNTRYNVLYRKNKIRPFYALWHPIAYF